jgi:hypothetical protein
MDGLSRMKGDQLKKNAKREKQIDVQQKYLLHTSCLLIA